MWHAVYVETPALHQLPEKQRRAILSALRLAQELGAETATLSDPAEDKAVIRYAREHNLEKLCWDGQPRAAGGAAIPLPTSWLIVPRISI